MCVLFSRYRAKSDLDGLLFHRCGNQVNTDLRRIRCYAGSDFLFNGFHCVEYCIVVLAVFEMGLAVSHNSGVKCCQGWQKRRYGVVS